LTTALPAAVEAAGDTDGGGEETMRRGTRLAIAGVVALVVLLGGGYAWLSARSSDAPAPAALDTAPTTAPASSAGASGDTSSGSATGADGTWRVRAGGSSFVGYRVREQLTFLSSPNEAVGRTTAVTGTLRIAGNRVEAASVQADLRELTSDESRRDNAIRNQGLESETFPTASFELAAPIVLPGAPTKGQQVNAQGQGRLSVHGVTRTVTMPLRSRWDGDTIQMAGQLPVRMSDYGIQPPRIGPVVSIEDKATIELRLVFERG
jgi:polyisoprenoid-binding protein YceI